MLTLLTSWLPGTWGGPLVSSLAPARAWCPAPRLGSLTDPCGPGLRCWPHDGDTATLGDMLCPRAGPLTHQAGPSPPPGTQAPARLHGEWTGRVGGMRWVVNRLVRERVSRPGEWRDAEGTTKWT